MHYGTKFVSLIVGQGEQEREFLIHKSLLCASVRPYHYPSDGFSSSEFIQTGDDKYMLPNEDPQLFKLVQDWIYKGYVAADLSSYTNSRMSCHTDEFWWRAYCMGCRLEMGRIISLAGEMIEELFSKMSPRVPSTEFIAALFNDRGWPEVEEYIVGHVAFWIHRSNADLIWSPLVDAHERFATNLAKAMMENIQMNHVDRPWYWGSLSLLDEECLEFPDDRARTLTDDSVIPLECCALVDQRESQSFGESTITEGVEQYQTIHTGSWHDDPLPCRPATPSLAEQPEFSCVIDEPASSSRQAANHAQWDFAAAPPVEHSTGSVRSAFSSAEIPVQAFGGKPADQIISEPHSIASKLESIRTMIEDIKINMVLPTETSCGSNVQQDERYDGPSGEEGIDNGGDAECDALGWGYDEIEAYESSCYEAKPEEGASGESDFWDAK